jgi:hypothetical protein
MERAPIGAEGFSGETQCMIARQGGYWRNEIPDVSLLPCIFCALKVEENLW